jgi:hypothetical protein
VRYGKTQFERERIQRNSGHAREVERKLARFLPQAMTTIWNICMPIPF